MGYRSRNNLSVAKYYAGSGRTFVAATDRKFNLLPFKKGFEVIPFQRGKMDSHVFTPIQRGDKTKTFVFFKPLKRNILNVWAQREGISAIAPGYENDSVKFLRSFAFRNEDFIKARSALLSKFILAAGLPK